MKIQMVQISQSCLQPSFSTTKAINKFYTYSVKYVDLTKVFDCDKHIMLPENKYLNFNKGSITLLYYLVMLNIRGQNESSVIFSTECHKDRYLAPSYFSVSSMIFQNLQTVQNLSYMQTDTTVNSGNKIDQVVKIIERNMFTIC